MEVLPETYWRGVINKYDDDENLNNQGANVNRHIDKTHETPLHRAVPYEEHRVGAGHKIKNISDHGNGWGNSMDWNLLGDYLPE